MRLLAATLALTDALLAVGVFLWLLRPEVGVGVVARLAGLDGALDRGELSEEQQARLVWAAGLARGPLLLLVFLWSLVAGLVLGLARAVPV